MLSVFNRFNNALRSSPLFSVHKKNILFKGEMIFNKSKDYNQARCAVTFTELLGESLKKASEVAATISENAPGVFTTVTSASVCLTFGYLAYQSKSIMISKFLDRARIGQIKDIPDLEKIPVYLRPYYLNKPDIRNKDTLLHYMARYGNIKLLSDLISMGASIIPKNNCGCTPLYEAASTGRADIISVLCETAKEKNISNDDFLNSKTKDGWTPLMASIAYRYTNAALKLIEEGADLHNMDNDNRTTFYWAVKNEDISVLRVLLSMNIKNKTLSALCGQYKVNVFHVVSKNGNVDIMKLLVRHLLLKEKEPEDFNILKSISGQKNHCRTPLMDASVNGNVGVVRIFMELHDKGIDIGINEKTTTGRNALDLVMSQIGFGKNQNEVSSYLEIKELLLLRLAKEIPPEFNFHEKLSFYASRMEKESFLKVLKDNHNNHTLFISTDKYGLSALYYAVRFNDIELIKTAMDFGFNRIKLTDSDEKTYGNVLYEACFFGAGNSVNYLIDCMHMDPGPVQEKGIGFGVTCLIIAVWQNDINIIEKIINEAKTRYGSFSKQFSDFINSYMGTNKNAMDALMDNFISHQNNPDLIQGLFKVFDLLIDSGVDVNIRSEKAKNNIQSPLHLAVKSGNLELCRKLIEKGANIEAKDKFGLTPLHYATIYGKPKVVLYLIEKNASLDVLSKDKKRPYEMTENQPEIKNIFNLVLQQKWANFDELRQVEVVNRNDCETQDINDNNEKKYNNKPIGRAK